MAQHKEVKRPPSGPGAALEIWRLSQGFTYRKLANRLALTTGHARQICLANAVPRPRTMALIYLVTQGAVCPNDFYDPPALDAAPAEGFGAGPVALRGGS